MVLFEARKLIETTKDGEFIIEKYHVVNVEMDSEIECIWERNKDDYESAYFNGLSGDFNDELAWMDIDRLLEHLKDCQDDGDDWIDFKSIILLLSGFKGYTFYKKEVKHD